MKYTFLLGFLLLSGGFLYAGDGASGVLFVMASRDSIKEKLPAGWPDLPYPLSNDDYDGLWVVAKIYEESNAHKAGLQEGDIVFRLQNKAVKGPEDFSSIRDQINEGETIKIGVKRLSHEPRPKWTTKTISFKAISEDVMEKYQHELDAVREEIEEARSPLEFTYKAGFLRANAIGIPEMHFTVTNATEVPVEAVEVVVLCFDAFGERVTFGGTNQHTEKLELTVAPGKTTDGMTTLNLFSDTTVALLYISRIKFADGEQWSQTEADAKKHKRLLPAKGVN